MIPSPTSSDRAAGYYRAAHRWARRICWERANLGVLPYYEVAPRLHLVAAESREDARAVEHHTLPDDALVGLSLDGCLLDWARDRGDFEGESIEIEN